MRIRPDHPYRIARCVVALCAVLALTMAPDIAAAAPHEAVFQEGRLSAPAAGVPAAAIQRQDTEQQSVIIRPERIQAIEPTIRDRAMVPVITAQGVDSVAVLGGGIQLQRGEFAVLSTGKTERVQGFTAAPGGEPVGSADDLPFFSMPFRFVTPDSALTGAWVLRPIYKIGNRLRWEPESERFEGLLLLAVEDTTRRRESRPLSAPIRFEFVLDAGSIDPTRLAIEHTNLPLDSVRILASFAEDSVHVHIVPEFDISGVDIWIPVEPSLTLSAPARIQGWGIESARVVARVVGTASLRPATVTLTSTEGALDVARLTTDGSGSTETRLRSAGLGGTTIRVGGPGLSAAAVDIDFIFPWIFLLAAVLGGAFGGVGSALHSRVGSGSVNWQRSIVGGVFAGLLAALAWYALGISLLQFDLGVQRFNEFAVFTLAALAGYFGIPKRSVTPERTPTTDSMG